MIDIIVPAEGGIEKCLIAKWYKKKGDPVKIGDVLCSVETDKAVMDITSPSDGFLQEILCEEGTEVPTLIPIARLGHQQLPETPASVSIVPGPPATKPAAEQKQPPPAMPNAIPSALVPASLSAKKEQLASPRAKRTAHLLGIDAKALSGSGFQGSVIEQDVIRAKHRQAAGGRMIPLTLHSKVDLTRVLELHHRFQGSLALFGNVSMTVSDMLLFAAVRSLAGFPLLNSVWAGDALRQSRQVNLCLASSTPNGLLFPVIQHADQKSILELSREIRCLNKSATNISTAPDDSSCGTFAAIDLNDRGITSFTPILHYPQVAILGIGKTIPQPIIRNGNLEASQSVMLSLTVDFQIVDYAQAADFMAALCLSVEHFDWLLVQ